MRAHRLDHRVAARLQLRAWRARRLARSTRPGSTRPGRPARPCRARCRCSRRTCRPPRRGPPAPRHSRCAGPGATVLVNDESVMHAPALVELAERRIRLARPAQEAVGVVLDDQDVVLGGQLQHAPAALERHRRAARVLEVRDHVEERRRPRARARRPARRCRCRRRRPGRPRPRRPRAAGSGCCGRRSAPRPARACVEARASSTLATNANASSEPLAQTTRSPGTP